MKEWLVKSAKCLILALNFENTKHCIIFEKVNKIKKNEFNYKSDLKHEMCLQY